MRQSEVTQQDDLVVTYGDVEHLVGISTTRDQWDNGIESYSVVVMFIPTAKINQAETEGKTEVDILEIASAIVYRGLTANTAEQAAKIHQDTVDGVTTNRIRPDSKVIRYDFNGEVRNFLLELGDNGELKIQIPAAQILEAIGR